MTKNKISLKHHVTRYCKPKDVENVDKIKSTAFELRENESYISVHWLEFFIKETKNQEEQLRKIYASQINHKNPNKKFTPSSSGVYTILNKNKVIKQIKKLFDISLMIEQLIEQNENSDSHSGIYGTRGLETAWVDLITDELATIANSNKKFLVSHIKKISLNNKTQ
jgi:hypothetical protein